MLTNESSGEHLQTARSVDAEMTQYQFVSEGNYCYKLRFSVLANNSLGMGNWSTTIIGHPIVGKVCVMVVTLTLQHKRNVVCQLCDDFC